MLLHPIQLFTAGTRLLTYSHLVALALRPDLAFTSDIHFERPVYRKFYHNSIVDSHALLDYSSYWGDSACTAPAAEKQQASQQPTR